MSDLTKLTLSMDRRTIAKAKRVAQARGTSVSAMFGQIVQNLDEPAMWEKIPLTPLARKALGLVKNPKKYEGKSDRELIEEALMEKYGLK